nr:MAG TPA: hypothetical protein [Caudoviricetes sp.]
MPYQSVSSFPTSLSVATDNVGLNLAVTSPL